MSSAEGATVASSRPSRSGELVVFDLQRFCLHDGPGLRTVVFLKGCSLRCQWCQNPESLRPTPEVSVYPERCLGCGACERACPNGARARGAGGPPDPDRSLCLACGACVQVCPGEALRLVGERLSVDTLLKRILADRAYFEASGGGVTLSGGEPLLQTPAVVELLAACRSEGLHTAVETSAAAPWSAFEACLPHVDRWLLDIKAVPDGLHRRLTGRPVARILTNARRLLGSGAPVWVRTPVVPGRNDDPAALEALARWLHRQGVSELRLLRYHAAGEAKIARVGAEQPLLGIDSERAGAALEAAAKLLRERNLRVLVVGTGESEPSGPADGDDGALAGQPAPWRVAGRDRRAAFPDRVWRLRDAVQAAEPTVCALRARLVTDYFRRHADGKTSMVLRKARALCHILAGWPARIYADELLVGCFSSHRVGGSIFPELHGVAMLEDLLRFDRREVNPLRIGARDRAALALKVLPYWLPRFLGLKAHSGLQALRFVREQLVGERYLVNESGGISHFVPDYERLLRLGADGIAAESAARAGRCEDPSERDFHRAVVLVCRGLAAFGRAYAAEARRLVALEPPAARRRDLLAIAVACEQVPAKPARTLHEAFQSMLFAQIALNLESLDNSVSPGRLDQLLAPYCKADLKAGGLDECAARDLVGCFTVKLSELVPVFSRRLTRFHGGLFNGQVVVVGGTDRDGADATNYLTWLFVDAMDSLRMRQPNYHARIHAGSPPGYVERIATTLRDGSGAPSVVNDDVIVPMLVDRGTDLADARDYSPVGCVEPVAVGRSFASTDAALVNLALPLQWALGVTGGGAATLDPTALVGPEALWLAYELQLGHLVAALIEDLQAVERANAAWHPTPLTSALIDGCQQLGRDASAGGARYNGSGVQGVGVADVADSFAALDEVVFQRRLVSLPTLVEALKADFVGWEVLRADLLRAPKYGNDHPLPDGYARRVVALLSRLLGEHTNTRGGPYSAGFYSVTAHVAFGETLAATPSGRLAGAPLANGLSPANGADRLGPTAALSSVASLDARAHARNGVTVNLSLDGSVLKGRAGVAAVEGLLKGYFRQGGMQVQLNMLDPAVLQQALQDPSSHPWLLVRVSGYSAYFADLSPAVRRDLVERTLHA